MAAPDPFDSLNFECPSRIAWRLSKCSAYARAQERDERMEQDAAERAPHIRPGDGMLHHAVSCRDFLRQILATIRDVPSRNITMREANLLNAELKAIAESVPKRDLSDSKREAKQEKMVKKLARRYARSRAHYLKQIRRDSRSAAEDEHTELIRAGEDLWNKGDEMVHQSY